MKYVDEYRARITVERLASAIARRTTRPWTIMEVCGGQTHAIVRFGIDALLPEQITLVHGPGCPVCVTPVEFIDLAINLAKRSNVVVCSFGDMLRVPGTQQDLLGAKAMGGDVRMVYAPLDAVKLAEAQPDREVVFFAVGFETTAPATALAVHEARRKNLANFSMLVAHVLVPPAVEAILAAPENRVQAFLAAGHVCTIMGYEQYEPIARQFRVPIVVTGFEPVDILQGVLMAIEQLEEGRFEVENQYRRSVRRGGNAPAQHLMDEVFEPGLRRWRGIGAIPASGLRLRGEYAVFDAERRFGLTVPTEEPTSECIAGMVLRGVKKPHECPAYGTRCTPDHPLGAPMVSSEGACAAYYRYRIASPRMSGPASDGKRERAASFAE